MTTIKRNLGILGAAAFLAAAATPWAADDTATQSGSAQTSDRGVHDARKQEDMQDKEVHTGPRSQPGRAAHDGRDESAQDTAKEHVGIHPDA